MNFNDLLKQYRSLPSEENITRVTLKNGIVVMLRQNPNSHAVSLAGYLRTGSANDPLDKLGLANFTAHALKYGTAHYTFQKIYELLESTGSNIGFSASIHNTNFSGRSLSEDLPMMLELLTECLSTPTFPEQEFLMLRDQLMTGLQIRAQNTRAMASMTFDELLYGDHSYGRPSEGNLDTVDNITRDDLADFQYNHYGPKGTVIGLTGDIVIEETIALLESTLGKWENPQQKPELILDAPVSSTTPKRRHITIPGKYQTDLVMGTVGPSRKTDDFLIGLLGNNILGQFGLMGRIGDVVRDQAGLAYYASTSLNATTLTGSWEVFAGVNPENLNKAINLIQQELKRFTTTPVLAEELSDSKANLIGRLPLSLESNAGVVYLLLRIERFNLGLNYLHDYVHAMQSFTAEDIMRVARQYIRLDHLVIASAGPELTEESSTR